MDTLVIGLTSFHPFHLGIVSQSTINTEVILPNTLMPVGKVIIGDLWVARNEVTAEVDLVIGMLEETGIACTREVEDEVDGREEEVRREGTEMLSTPGRKSLW